MENHQITIFHGKLHYFDWAMFHCYVSSPEGKHGKHHGLHHHEMLSVNQRSFYMEAMAKNSYEQGWKPLHGAAWDELRGPLWFTLIYKSELISTMVHEIYLLESTLYFFCVRVVSRCLYPVRLTYMSLAFHDFCAHFWNFDFPSGINGLITVIYVINMLVWDGSGPNS